MTLRALLITALLGALAASPAVAQGDAARGEAPYLKYCSQCHGDTGEADGPAAPFMLPRPRVFRDNMSYKFRTTASGELPTDQDLYRVIVDGIPGTAMPGFPIMTEQERWDVIEHIKAMAEEFSDPDYLETAVVMDELANLSPLSASEESIARGKEVFEEQKCWQCHGQTGLGNGPSWPDLADEWGNPILPANLANPEHFRNGHGKADIFRTFTTGTNGSPMPSYEIPAEDRWHLVNYMTTFWAAPEERTDVVIAKQVEELPDSPTSEAWNELPRTRFETFSNIVEPPRLYWPTVAFVSVRAAYTDGELAMLVQWDDRSQSTGSDADGSYEDRDGTIHAGTTHPDQLAVQFPVKTGDPKVRPYFMFGDNKRAVNLWWWRGDTGETVDMSAKGFGTQAPQPSGSQDLISSLVYDDGRYLLMIRRPLTTSDTRNDVQFAAGDFTPIAFHAWDGDRGEVGQRRALTTWYWLYFEPPVARGKLGLRAALIGLLTLGVLGAVVITTRKNAKAAT